MPFLGDFTCRTTRLGMLLLLLVNPGIIAHVRFLAVSCVEFKLTLIVLSVHLQVPPLCCDARLYCSLCF